MRKYGESKTTRIMKATVPHVTSGLGLRTFQADGFLLTRVYNNFRGAPAASFNASLPSPSFAPPFLPYLVLMSAPAFPSAANSFRADVDNSSFRNVGKCVLHIRCCISDNSVIGRSVFQFFSDPTQDGRQCVDRGPVYVNEGNNYVVLFRTQPSQL